MAHWNSTVEFAGVWPGEFRGQIGLQPPPSPLLDCNQNNDQAPQQKQLVVEANLIATGTSDCLFGRDEPAARLGCRSQLFVPFDCTIESNVVVVVVLVSN